MRAPDDPGAADVPQDDWPDKPDIWAEADRRWEETWSGDDDADDPPPATALPRLGPREEPPNAVEAYARGMHEAGPYLGLGFQIAGAMALFTGGGYLLDGWLGTSPWGIILGAAVAFVGIIALVVRLGKGEDAKR